MERAAAEGVHAAIAFRVPSWATSPSATLRQAAAEPPNFGGAGGGGGGGGGGEGASGGSALSPVESGSLMRVERTWREGDEVSLSLPASLRTSRLPDERPKYRRLFALLHGPVVLACVGCLRPLLPGGTEAELLEMLEPVPAAASAQLRTLRRIEERGAPPGTLLLHADRLWLREGRLPALPLSRRRGGSDLAGVVTLREVAGLGGGDNLVSFSPFGRPGCWLAAPQGGSGGQVELLCLHRGVQPSPEQARRASWRRHDPLLAAAHGSPHLRGCATRAGAVAASGRATAV